MMNKIMLIDGDNMMHRAFHKFTGLTNEDGKPSSLVFGVPYILRNILFKVKPNKVYFVMDGGRHISRTSLLPGYKDRDKSDKDYTSFYEQKEYLKSFLPYLNLHVSWLKGYEADDLIYYLRKEKFRENEVTVVSSDKDFNQMLNPKTQIWNPSKDCFITHKNCERVTGIKPENWLEYLIIDGDKSDKIPGYKGMGEKRIAKFFEAFDSIPEYLDSDIEFPGLDRKKMEELYHLNRKLISLFYWYKIHGLVELKYKEITSSACFDKRVVYKTFSDYNITSLMNDSFLSHFKDLK